MPRDLIKLSELYQGRLFRIPDYQRGYAWKEEHLVAFWNDLMNLQMGRDHYTGMLSLKTTRDTACQTHSKSLWIPSGSQLCHVVDGQQRLTTISILLFEITSLVRGLATNQGKPDDEIVILDATLQDIVSKYIYRTKPPDRVIKTYVFGYETDNPSELYLRHIIFEDPQYGAVSESYYTRNLNYAKSFLRKNLESEYQISGMQGIETLYEKLTQHLLFNLHDIKDDYDVFVAFETMNNRGKKLTNLELLKNRLIYLTTLFEDHRLDEDRKREYRKQINEVWSHIYFELGRNKNALLNDDEFLRAHWILYFQYTRRRGDDYINFLMTKFSAQSVFPKRMIQTLPERTGPEEQGDEWDDLQDEEQEPENDAAITTASDAELLEPIEIWGYIQDLRILSKHWYISHFPTESKDLSLREKVLIDRLNRMRIAYFRPLVAAVLMNTARTLVKDRIAFLEATERFIFLFFRMAGYRANYLQSHFYAEIRDFLAQRIALSDITEDLDSRVDADMQNIIEMFIARTIKRFDSGEGFYAWRPGLMYLLYEYEEHIASLKGNEKLTWRSFTRYEAEKVSVEHILPQTPTPHYWRNQFRGYDDQEKKRLSGSLGNLLPLAESINKSLQNDSFPDKKTGKNRRGYDSGSHSEIEVSKYADWTPESIQERGYKLLNFLERRWRISLSDDQKARILNIHFVNDGRDKGEELSQEIEHDSSSELKTSRGRALHAVEREHLAFWRGFVEYCKSIGRDDIAARGAAHYSTYDYDIGRNWCFVQVQRFRRIALRIGLVFRDAPAYDRFKQIEGDFVKALRSRQELKVRRTGKSGGRAYVEVRTELMDPEKKIEHYEWIIEQADKMMHALARVSMD